MSILEQFDQFKTRPHCVVELICHPEVRRTLFVNGVNFRRAWVITGPPSKLIRLQGSPLRNDRDQTGRHAHSILILKLDFWFTGSFLFEITLPLCLSRAYFRDVITMWQIAITIFHPTLSTTRQPYIVRFKQHCSLCVLWKLSDKRCVWLLAPASFFFSSIEMCYRRDKLRHSLDLKKSLKITIRKIWIVLSH